MMWYTHVSFGFFLGLFFHDYVFLGLVVFGSLLPDVDYTGSKINQILPGTRWVALFLTHRGFFHSLFPAAVLYVVFFVFGLGWVGLALSLGYLSHLFLDSLTKMGVHLFHPYIPVRGFIEVGGFIEKILFVCVLSITAFLVFLR